MFRLWSEWYIGSEDKIFASREALTRWLRTNESVIESAAEEKMSIDEFINDCFDNGYFGLEDIEIIE